MAASATVSQLRQFCNLLAPRRGVVTLFGYGIKVYVDRGHLTLEDGIGIDRHKTRFPRIGHGIRRIVVIGSDGMVSLSALRWLADQDAAFVLLDRDGSVLATTGPVRPSDARLRRAQVLAHHSGAALQIIRQLISQKLEGQEKLASNGLGNTAVAQAISGFREEVATAPNMEAVRFLEARAGHAYWSAWRALPVCFPRNDLVRVPDHWRTFGTRVSPLTGSPRLAANPPNAMLNYLYALLESETRLSIAALGLDPGLGIMHVDSQARDSLACDVMEPIRPQVDAYVLAWIGCETLRREWFFEERNGNCRLMGPFAAQLSETARTWGRAVAPVAEWVTRTLWSTMPKSTQRHRPPTRLTQSHRREAKGVPQVLPPGPLPRPESFCKDCGAEIGQGRSYCASCAIKLNTVGLVKAAERGRVVAQGDQAQSRRADTQRRHETAKASWRPSNLPSWITEEFYLREIRPQLKRITLSLLASTLGISIPYAVDIRSGRRVPHQRHWQKLAGLVGVKELSWKPRK